MSRVQIRRRGRVAEIECRFPRQRLDESSAQELTAVAAELRLDDEAALVLLRSHGADFCTGADVSLVGALDCVDAIASLPQPVVAAVQGKAWAEGCELALACDLRLAGADASFRLPQVADGSLPRNGATQRLPRLVGAARGLEMMWSGRIVRAVEAERIGLVSRRAKPGELARLTKALVADLAAKGPIALRLAKEAVLQAADLTLAQGTSLEQDLYVLLQTTADRAEGIRAFQRKRRPRYRGR